ncbi:MAG: histidine kinase [Anaerolineae bacterium]|nr:histidine kinase [Anaerolineae bacterium]
MKAQIAALRARWPRHSVPPALWQELEALEQRLEELNAE